MMQVKLEAATTDRETIICESLVLNAGRPFMGKHGIISLEPESEVVFEWQIIFIYKWCCLLCVDILVKGGQ